MKTFKGKLIERIERVYPIESFRFSLDEKLDFIPGQFLRVIFDEDNIENRELNKYLSLSSSVTKDYIEVTKKLSDSAFSSKLKDLKLNDEVLFKGPLGNCTFKDDYKKIGFLIGGIGITPVISIIEYIVDKQIDTDVLLFYSNSSDLTIAFRKELNYWQSANKNIKIFFTVSDCDSKDAACIKGRISKELLVKEVNDMCEREFFIFGPPRMVDAMKSLCEQLNCEKQKIMAENFIGY